MPSIKDFFYELKDENATENSISDLAKDVILDALIDMKVRLKERARARKEKMLFIPAGLTKEDTILIIFLAKSKAGFIEAKKAEDSEQDDDDSKETISSIAEEFAIAKEKFYPATVVNDNDCTA